MMLFAAGTPLRCPPPLLSVALAADVGGVPWSREVVAALPTALTRSELGVSRRRAPCFPPANNPGSSNSLMTGDGFDAGSSGLVFSHCDTVVVDAAKEARKLTDLLLLSFLLLLGLLVGCRGASRTVSGDVCFLAVLGGGVDGGGGI